MRNHEPIEVAIPGARRVVGALLFLFAGLLLVGWMPFSAQTIGLAMLLVGAGLMV
jgi:hypothetical protein